MPLLFLWLKGRGCGRCIGAAMLQGNPQLAVYPVSERAAVKIAFLIPPFLTVRRAKLCQCEVNRFVPGLPVSGQG